MTRKFVRTRGGWAHEQDFGHRAAFEIDAVSGEMHGAATRSAMLDNKVSWAAAGRWLRDDVGRQFVGGANLLMARPLAAVREAQSEVNAIQLGLATFQDHLFAIATRLVELRRLISERIYLYPAPARVSA